MFETRAELDRYILENYPEVSSHRINGSHWDFECTRCKVTRGFQVVQRAISGGTNEYGDFSPDFSSPLTYVFRCPVCETFKLWSVFELQLNEGGKWVHHYYRVTAIPSEGLEDISELPAEPTSLRIAYRQAIRAMDANAYLAAAAMFRRAVQVITRMLGANPGHLAVELQQVVGTTYQGAMVTGRFADIGYIIKEAGNQGAHPDKDPDLLEFTQQDAEDLQTIFMELVSELFVIPAAVQKTKAEFLARKKITPKAPTAEAKT